MKQKHERVSRFQAKQDAHGIGSSLRAALDANDDDIEAQAHRKQNATFAASLAQMNERMPWASDVFVTLIGFGAVVMHLMSSFLQAGAAALDTYVTSERVTRSAAPMPTPQQPPASTTRNTPQQWHGPPASTMQNMPQQWPDALGAVGEWHNDTSTERIQGTSAHADGRLG